MESFIQPKATGFARGSARTPWSVGAPKASKVLKLYGRGLYLTSCKNPPSCRGVQFPSARFLISSAHAKYLLTINSIS